MYKYFVTHNLDKWQRRFETLVLVSLALLLGACTPVANSVTVETTRQPKPTDASTVNASLPASSTSTPSFTATALPPATDEAAVTATAAAIAADLLTRMAIPTETLTPTPMPSPTIIPTPTAVPSDVVWMEATWIYDGGYQLHDRYRSTYMPIFVLQANGRLLRQSATNWYEETILTNEEMCALRADLVETGIFMYTGIPFKVDMLTKEQMDILNGSGPFHMDWLIHGDPTATLYIPLDHEFQDHLVDELSNAWTILNTYLSQDTAPYVAEGAVVHIQIGLDDEIDDRPITPWPTVLPTLADLVESGTPFDLVDGYPGVEVILRDEELALFQAEFGMGMMEGGFHEDSKDYYVMLRPLLPLDRTEMRWASFYEAGFRPVTYPLPFARYCDT